jgi:CrcB protein
VIVLLVFVGGAIGAPSRYVMDRYVQSRHRLRFPLGTLTVNLLGCLVLGLLAGSDWSTGQHALIGTGFCGGLTTFSTFSVETVELLQGRRAVAATGYVMLSCAFGIGAAALGYSLG